MPIFLVRLVYMLACLLPFGARAESIMVNSSSGEIYLVEVETLALTRVATAPQFFDIAVDPRGEIFGVTAGGQIWQIDPKGHHVPLAVARVFVNALDFRRDGALFAAGYDQVVRLSVTDGRTETFATRPGFGSSGDLAFGPDGVLYATGSPGPGYEDALFRVPPGRPMEPVGPIGFRNVYGLAWSERTGQLFGVTETRELIVIDRQTGAGRLLGVLDFAGFGYGASGLGGNAVISRASRRLNGR